MINNNLNKPKIAVVVGSGGIKPLSAIPLFEFLEEEKIQIDLLIGCSGGSVPVALKGLGYKSNEIYEIILKNLKKDIFKSINYHTLLSIANLVKFERTHGILKPDKIQKIFKNFFLDLTFKDFKIPVLLQTTDIDTGEGVILDNGLINEAVYASIAQFPFFPPIKINNRWLVDGGYSSPLPILEAVNRKYDIIIAVSIEQQTIKEPKTFLEFLHRFITRSYVITQKQQTTLAIDMHHYEIIILNMYFDDIIHMWNIEQIPKIVETGKKIVENKKEEILLAIKNFKNK